MSPVSTGIFERLESEVRTYCRTYPTVFDTANNARQRDVGGREFIDFFGGAGVLNYGHNNARMRQAMIDYMMADGVAHSLDFYTRAKAEFMTRFEEVILKPRALDYKLQFPAPTGTNVVEAALKLARKATGRMDVIAFTNGFHGMSLGALACTGNAHFRDAAGVPLDHVLRVPYDGFAGEGRNSLDVLERELDDASSGIAPPAAFIVETIQAEGGVNVASREWLQSLQKLARKHGSLLIVDDIQVGNGRTGRFFSFEDHGIEPDLVCLAKGIGGYGTPLGLLLIRPEYDMWKPGEHTGTFRGQDLSFVAGAEALNYYKTPDFLDAVRGKGEGVKAKLESIAARKEGIRLRGRGMIYGLDFGSGERAAKVIKAAFETGLLIGGCGTDGRVLKFMSPLTIEDDTLSEGLDLLEQAVREAA
ncbi:MAG: diaminobutyrate--2-oxoglutarate transaminase [Gammaproteobacteria bacterium]|nr:diaminobutyrate--2-oxoglutarate transaminase [Gammaproteobacteria bacterium]